MPSSQHSPPATGVATDSDEPFRPAPEQVLPGLWRLTLPMHRGDGRSVNAYLAADRDGYLLVDSGIPGDESWACFSAHLAQLGIPLAAIHTIVLTHAHPDHFGLAGRIVAQTEARLTLHAADADYARQRFVERHAYQPVLARWLERHGVPSSEAAELVESYRAFDQTAPPAPGRLLQGGETLRVGSLSLEVLWTPGHTPGHICLYEPNRRMLLCGDHILEMAYPNVGLQPLGAGNPMASYLGSLRHLARLDPVLTLPGHGPPIAGLADRVHQVLRHQLGRQARLLELLTDAPQTAYDLARQIWDAGRRRPWHQLGRRRRNALATVAAHLELLVAEDRVDRFEDQHVRFARRRVAPADVAG